MYNGVQRLTYTESYIPGLHISHGGEFSRLPAHIKTYSFYCGLISIILFLPNFRWVSLISVLLIYLPCDIHIFPVCSVSLSLYKPNVPFPPTGSLPLFSEPHGSILSSKLSLCLMGVIMMVPSVSDGAQASVNVQLWVLHLPPSPTTPWGLWYREPGPTLTSPAPHRPSWFWGGQMLSRTISSSGRFRRWR